MHSPLPLSRTFPPRLTRYALRHPRRYLLLYGVACVALVVALVWAFALIADAVPENGRMVRIDRWITAFMLSHDTEWGETLFLGISYLGPPVIYAAVVLGVAWFVRSRDWLRAGTVLASGAGGIILDNILKALFHRGRPESAIEFIHRQSWSFPSGHAMDTITTYGILLVLARESMLPGRRRTAVLLGGAIVIALVAFSRVYLGVHYLSDVVGGWIAGGAWLVAVVTAYQFVRSALRQMPMTPDRPEVLKDHLARRRSA